MTTRLTRRGFLGSAAAFAGAGALCGVPRRLRAAGRLPAQITDGQVHLWQAGGEKMPSSSGRQDPLLAEDLLQTMDANGVDRAVIVPPSWAPSGNDYALASAQAHPERLAVLGLISMPGEAQRAEVEGWLEQPGMYGMRMFLSHERGAQWLRSGGADWLWPVLAERAIPLSIHAGLSLDVLAEAKRAHPDLKLCLDAFGLSTNVEAAAAGAAFEEVVAKMADLPDVMIKTGAIPRDSGDAFPFANAQKLVTRAIGAFGAERLIWASDLTLLKGPYSEGLEFWTALDDVSDADRARILGANMNDWLGWI